MVPKGSVKLQLDHSLAAATQPCHHVEQLVQYMDSCLFWLLHATSMPAASSATCTIYRSCKLLQQEWQAGRLHWAASAVPCSTCSLEFVKTKL